MLRIRGVAVVVGALLAAGVGCSSKGKSHSPSATSDDGGSAEAGDDSGSGDDGGGEGGSQEASVQCTYPSGPYGIAMGSVIYPAYTWKGYLPGSTTLSTIRSRDLYDCDGSKGINAILFDSAALWCGPCQMEAQDQSSLVQTGGKWLQEGVAWVTLVIQDSNMNPATTANALAWRNEFKLQQAYVFADPAWDFSHPGQNGLPTNVLVDPRTMKVVGVIEGYTGPDDPAVDQLALKNAMH
jgi:hypothetical protein